MRAHFEDADYYTHTYAERTEDVAFYVEAGVRSGGPVLEYGIGNGRIAIPLARRGVEVAGVDLSRPMLADLRARVAKEPPAVRAPRARARRRHGARARLGERFALVTCPFNTALHLYERRDVEAWLARVREHLTPRGELLEHPPCPRSRTCSGIAAGLPHPAVRASDRRQR